MKYAKYIACLTVALLLTVELFAQTAVSGRITDKNGESVIGATILVKGTTIGTSSDARRPLQNGHSGRGREDAPSKLSGLQTSGNRRRDTHPDRHRTRKRRSPDRRGRGRRLRNAAQERRDGSRHLGQNRQERSRAGRLVRQTASGPCCRRAGDHRKRRSGRRRERQDPRHKLLQRHRRTALRRGRHHSQPLVAGREEPAGQHRTGRRRTHWPPSARRTSPAWRF